MVYSFGTYTRKTETFRWSSISLTSLRASSTGWTFVLKARPNRPSNRLSIFCSIVRSTFTAGVSPPPSLAPCYVRQTQAESRNPPQEAGCGGQRAPRPGLECEQRGADPGAGDERDGRRGRVGEQGRDAEQGAVAGRGPFPASTERVHGGRRAAQRQRLEQEAVGLDEAAPQGRPGAERAVDAADGEVGPGAADERHRVAGEVRCDRGRADRRARLSRAARCTAGGKDDEREEPQRAEGREQRAHDEEQRGPGPPPEAGEPEAGEREIEDRQAAGDVPERQHRNREREGQAQPRRSVGEQRGQEGERDRPVRGKERQRRRRPPGEQRRRDDRDEARQQLWEAGRQAHGGDVRAGVTVARPGRAPQAGREPGGRGP